jgi:hypothetical protein
MFLPHTDEKAFPSVMEQLKGNNKETGVQDA